MKTTLVCMSGIWFCSCALVQALTINHIQGNAAFFAAITSQQVQNAKNTLHSAYGHTSHGSQLTTGMTALNDFINGGGLGMSRPADFYDWNHGGTGGALDLHDYAMDGDCGYYPDWVNNTTAYLNDPAHSNCNVIIWSWCGQVPDKYSAGTLSNEYLVPMAALETAYPHVTFVYMTGHLDHWDGAHLKAGNTMIRNFCAAHNKLLYDFADIESYDPDGTYYEFADDSCEYYQSVSGALLGNWAVHWQTSHIENIAWYSCESQHSEPLNANQKAYGAWALWTEIAAVPEPGAWGLLALFTIYKLQFTMWRKQRRGRGEE